MAPPYLYLGFFLMFIYYGASGRHEKDQLDNKPYADILHCVYARIFLSKITRDSCQVEQKQGLVFSKVFVRKKRYKKNRRQRTLGLVWLDPCRVDNKWHKLTHVTIYGNVTVVCWETFIHKIHKKWNLESNVHCTGPVVDFGAAEPVFIRI